MLGDIHPTPPLPPTVTKVKEKLDFPQRFDEGPYLFRLLSGFDQFISLWNSASITTHGEIFDNRGLNVGIECGDTESGNDYNTD